MSKYNNSQKLAAIKREIALRKSAYPGWVRTGRMRKGEADYQIEIFEEIAEDIEQKILAETHG